MKLLIAIMIILLFDIPLFIWSTTNYKQEKKLGLKHKYGFLIISVLLLLIAFYCIFTFLDSLPNATY